MGGKNLKEARPATKRWADTWEDIYFAAARCLSNDLENLLTCFCFADPSLRRKMGTTNAIERIFMEVRRRVRSI